MTSQACSCRSLDTCESYLAIHQRTELSCCESRVSKRAFVFLVVGFVIFRARSFPELPVGFSTTKDAQPPPRLAALWTSGWTSGKRCGFTCRRTRPCGTHGLKHWAARATLAPPWLHEAARRSASGKPEQPASNKQPEQAGHQHEAASSERRVSRQHQAASRQQAASKQQASSKQTASNQQEGRQRARSSKQQAANTPSSKQAASMKQAESNSKQPASRQQAVVSRW